MESIDKEIIIEKTAEYGIILEKSYTIDLAFEHLAKKDGVEELVKTLNPIWGEHILYFNYKGKTYVVVSAKGASVAVNAVERVRRTGGKYITLIGTCGSTSEQIDDGTFLLARAGVRDEGSSIGYLDLKCPSLADEELTESIKNELEQREEHPCKGVAFTTDKRYKEDSDLLKFLHEHLNVCYVDMETAAVLLVSTYYKIKVAAVKVVTDCAVKETDGQLKGIFDRSKDFVSFTNPRLLKALDATMDAYSKI